MRRRVLSEGFVPFVSSVTDMLTTYQWKYVVLALISTWSKASERWLMTSIVE
jgi:hypothetical protein